VSRFKRVSLAPALALVFALACVACSAPEPAATSVTVASEHGLVEADVRFVGPVARGDNELFIALHPRTTMDGAELLAVDASMAAHAHEAHAGSIAVSDSGFRVAQLDLFMTGRWQLELSVAVADQIDSVSLPVDVP
jgi:hypothetical protein